MTDCERARSAAHPVRGVGPRESELDGDTAARRTREDGQREQRIDALWALVHVNLMLLLGVSHAAERRAHLHGDPIKLQFGRLEFGVAQGQPRGRDAELPESVEAARALDVHVVGGVESVDLGRHVGPKMSGVEPRDSPDGRLVMVQARPESLDPDPYWRDATDARNGDAAAISSDH